MFIVSEDLAQQFGYKKQEGALISQVLPGSPAPSAGLRPGMLISEVNKQIVRNTNEFLEELNKSMETKRALLLVQDRQYSRYVVLDLK